MSSKLGLVLSMIFVTMFFAFGLDLVCIQFIYNDLDAKSIAISYKISEYGTINQSFVKNIEQTFKVDFYCTGNCSPIFGDTVTYVIAKEYKPLIIKKESMTISIERNAVIGYMN
jgi:hypothetical protein